MARSSNIQRPNYVPLGLVTNVGKVLVLSLSSSLIKSLGGSDGNFMFEGCGFATRLAKLK